MQISTRTLTSVVLLVVIAAGILGTGSFPVTKASAQKAAFLSGNVSNIPVISASPFFGFTENSTNPANFPTVSSYGMQRILDSPPLQWPSLNTCASFPTSNCNLTTNLSVYNFNSLDTMLNQDNSNGTTEVEYVLTRTPPWFSSNQTTPDNTCAYNNADGTSYTQSNGRGPGECYPPSDLNTNGSGANAIWKDWVTRIASHVNANGYAWTTGGTHAHIRYWSIWNEPDDGCGNGGCYYHGSIAQLARMYEDANCIITGRGVIHQNGDGTSVPCSATPIDPTALILLAPNHGKGNAIAYTQNQLYCNKTSTLPSFGTPCPNPADIIAQTVDVIVEHLKPGSEGNTAHTCGPNGTDLCSPETAMQLYVANIHAALAAGPTTAESNQQLAKPLWNDETAYCPQGFTDATCPSYADDDMSASFFPRHYLIMWSLGITGSAWYTWDDLSGQSGTKGPASLQQTMNWLIGATMPTPCSNAGNVSLWTCFIQKNGVQYMIMWDSSKSCSGGTCTTANQSIPAQWAFKQDMTSASTPTAVAGGTAAIGIKPTIFSGALTVINPQCGVQPCGLQPGIKNTAYVYIFQAANGVPPYTYSITSGTIPAGLTLNTTAGCGSDVHCQLSGTPTASATTNLTLTVTDSASHTTNLPITITVN